MLLIQASVASGGSHYEPNLTRKTTEARRGGGLLALAGAGSVSPTGGSWMPSSTRRLLGHENGRAQRRLHSSVTKLPWFAGTSRQMVILFLMPEGLHSHLCTSEQARAASMGYSWRGWSLPFSCPQEWWCSRLIRVHSLKPVLTKPVLTKGLL